MPKRFVVVLTAAERDLLRAAVRTADEEDCGAAAHARLVKLEGKVNNAVPVTRAAWSNLHHAIGNSLQDEPEALLPSPASRRSAIGLWEAFNRALFNFR